MRWLGWGVNDEGGGGGVIITIVNLDTRVVVQPD